MSTMGDESGRKFTRCIICSDRTIKNQCSNIFNTTLEDGQILLSDFVKNVLSCSVLIVVPPEFYICNRCFSLCSELDTVQVRCKQLQQTIQLLFSKSKEHEEFIKQLALGNVNTETLNTIKDDPENEETAENIQQFWCSTTGEGKVETIECVQKFLENNFDNETVRTRYTDKNFKKEVVEEDDYVNKETLEDKQQLMDSTNVVIKMETFGTNLNNESLLEARTNTDNENIQRSMEEGINPYEEAVEDSTICWTCGACDVAFKSEEELDIHSKDGCQRRSNAAKIKSFVKFKYYSVKLKKKNKVLFCNRCSYETEHLVSMEKHILDHKKDPVFMCDTCGKRFHHQHAFNKHRKTHDENRQFPCNLCSYRSTTCIGLQQHVRQHDEEKKYSCSICDYSTIKKNSLLIHLRTHTGERPYCCPSCPYRAKDHSTLHRHRRLHEGLKLYSCTVCSYKAVQKASLNIHMRSHTGEKPYSCQHCDYESAVKHNVRAHVLVKHPSQGSEKSFACSECDYKTRVKRSLTSHMRRHTGEKPFVCTQCEYRASHSTALKYHQRTQHPTADQIVLGLPRYVTSNVIRLSELVFSDEDASDGEC